MLNRRTFVRRTTAGVLGLSAAAWPLRIQTASQARRIIVIGAGMAGLSTAFELVALGHEVTVLEARTRPGGRVFTMRESFADGLYADAGAMQVYDSHTRAQKYIKQFDLELDPIRPTASGSLMHVMGRRLATKAGDPVQWPFPLNDDEKALTSGGLYAKYVTPHLKAVLAADAQGQLLAQFGKYDSLTFSDFLRSQGASPAAIKILNIGLPIGLGDGGDHHSALNLLREAAYRSLRTQSFTIRGGTDRLPKALASRLGDKVHYGTPVVRIEQDATGVRVTAMQRGSPRTLSADRVVCAVPFSVLRNVGFSPAVSRETRAAMDDLPNTSVVKVFVQIRHLEMLGRRRVVAWRLRLVPARPDDPLSSLARQGRRPHTLCRRSHIAHTRLDGRRAHVRRARRQRGDIVMRSIALLVVLLLVAPVVSGSSRMVVADTIQGRWKLLAAEDIRADGSVARLPWGKRPVGAIVVEGGYCYVQIMSSDVPSFTAGKPIGEQMTAALLSTYIAYSGPCTVDDKEGSVTLKVESAWRPSYVGTEQKRFFKFDNGKMFFGPAVGSMRLDNEALTRRLTLERVAP